jgi:ectoine hydroxylase-related dioxygenase (phytanoyl-CoA dioxygenase family)
MFRDPRLAADFARDGFVVVPFLDAAGVQELAELFRSIEPPELKGIWSNVHGRSRETNLLVDETIRRRMAPRVDELFEGCDLAGATFLVKGTGEGSESKPHQDWNNVDERSFLSLSVWCPLVDVDEVNGALQVLKGSHRLFDTVRAITLPSVYLEFDAELEALLTPVPMRAGEACIYAHNLFHGSKPNRSGSVRVAAVSGVLPRGATHLHYFQAAGPAESPQSKGPLEAFAIDREFFYGGLLELYDGRRPEKLRPLGVVDREVRPLTRDEVLTAVREDRATPASASPAVEPARPVPHWRLPEAAAVPRVFTDPVLQARYERDGYVVVPFLSPDEVAGLRARYDALPRVDDAGFFASLYTANRTYKEMAHTALAGLGERLCGAFLRDYEVLIGNFVTKKNGDTSLMPPHQDWSFVDESQHASMNLWLPLVDVDDRNGAIYLLPGGHRLPFTVRGTLVPNAFAEISGLDFEHLTYLPMRAGDVLIYDHRLVHASPPNRTGEVRVAAAMAALPRAAQPVHYFANPATAELELYRAGRQFFMDYVFGENRMPAGAELAAVCEGEVRRFGQEEIAPLLASRPIFRDPELQARFERDGYVVVPFLSTASCARIREIFDRLDAGIANGFYSSLFSRSREYKEAVDREVRAVVGDAPAAWLDGYRSLVANFVVKMPGPESDLPVHQDWNIVDERRFRSLNVWFPVTEVGESEGQLRVMPGSHRTFGGLRGSPAFPSALDDLRALIRERYLEPLAVRVGEAVIHDNRLVHASSANLSPRPRVAVCLNMIPEEAQPLHYYRRADGVVECFRVRDDFFTSFDIGNRPEGELLATLPAYEPERISPAELAARHGREERPDGEGEKSVAPPPPGGGLARLRSRVRAWLRAGPSAP